MKPKIFLLYPYYYPHYKAGGPVQSIYNLAGYFSKVGEFFLVSLNKDIDNSVSQLPVVCDAWQNGPQGERIYYTSSFSFKLIRKLMLEVKPDVVFVNGLFNISTTLPGIVCAQWFCAKLIISPRGVLQPWALKHGRPLLKLIFIQLLKILTDRKTEWHGTDELERADIQNKFGMSARVHVAANIPRPLIEFTSLTFSPANAPIKLVFLSLINPNKNLHLIIDAVNNSGGKFVLDIYGPVANQSYWEMCEERISSVNSWIDYKGAVMPWQVQDILKQYHFFVLLTAGENFGHAIFDALSASVPVIISRNTPWKDIDDLGAGFYATLESIDSLSDILSRIEMLTESEYQLRRRNAHRYASDFLASKHYMRDYQFLLGNPGT